MSPESQNLAIATLYLSHQVFIRHFAWACRKLGNTTQLAAKAQHSAIDGRTQRHEGYKTSLRVLKQIEEAFGWIKTVGSMVKTKLIGQAKLAGLALMCFATYNLDRAWLHRWLVVSASTVNHYLSVPKMDCNRPRQGRSRAINAASDG